MQSNIISHQEETCFRLVSLQFSVLIYNLFVCAINLDSIITFFPDLLDASFTPNFIKQRSADLDGDLTDFKHWWQIPVFATACIAIFTLFLANQDSMPNRARALFFGETISESSESKRYKAWLATIAGLAKAWASSCDLLVMGCDFFCFGISLAITGASFVSDFVVQRINLRSKTPRGLCSCLSPKLVPFFAATINVFYLLSAAALYAKTYERTPKKLGITQERLLKMPVNSLRFWEWVGSFLIILLLNYIIRTYLVYQPRLKKAFSQPTLLESNALLPEAASINDIPNSTQYKLWHRFTVSDNLAAFYKAGSMTLSVLNISRINNIAYLTLVFFGFVCTWAMQQTFYFCSNSSLQRNNADPSCTGLMWWPHFLKKISCRNLDINNAPQVAAS